MVAIKFCPIEGAMMPSRAHSTDCGWDIYAPTKIALTPGIQIVPLGFKVEIPPGWALLLVPRSGLASKGITLANSPGVIDAGYRGEVKALFLNLTDNLYSFQKGERIAQFLLVQVPAAQFVATDSLSPSDRGDKGIGGTGK